MSYTYEELESFAGDVNLALGGEGMSLDEMREALKARLMPEGMEWPRFEDGEPVAPGARIVVDGPDGDVPRLVDSLMLYKNSSVQVNYWGGKRETELKYVMVYPGGRVKRPPVLDADGTEIHKGDTVYAAPGVVDVGWVIPYTVGRVHDRRVDLICDGESEPSLINISGERLTHRQYVIAKDASR